MALPEVDDTSKANEGDITLLKGEKKEFEESNPPDGVDDDELAKWNYAKELERQARDLKAENKDALKRLVNLEKRATKTRATEADKRAEIAAKIALEPVLNELAEINAALEPYERFKDKLAAARALYRRLTNAFISELKSRASQMTDLAKRGLVLELIAQDVRARLDGTIADKRRTMAALIERLWDKYRVDLN